MDKPKGPENTVVNENFNWWKIAAISLCVVFVVIVFIGGTYHKNIERKYNGILEDASKLNGDLSKEKAALDHELDKLKGQLEGIKDRDDLLKRDIKLYIDTTYPKVPSVVAKSIAKNVVEISRKYKVSPELVMGIIKVESYFNPMAVGPKTKYGHARGLMQVMPEWAPKLELKNQYDFHDIDKGIESGIRVFLIHLEEAKGDISKGLYLYVNKDKTYVGNVYSAMGKFVAFRSTIDEDTQNTKSEVEGNNDSKKLPDDKKGEPNDNAATRK